MESDRLSSERALEAEAPRHRTLCAWCRVSTSPRRLRSVEGRILCPDCARRAEREPTPSQPTSSSPNDPNRGGLHAFVEDMRAWCEEAAWVPRVPVLALLGYWAIQHLRDPAYAGLIDALNFGIHELGHVVFAAGGEFIGIAGGTLLQLSAPLVGAIVFARQRDYFAIAFALGWLATNVYDVAVYVADARARSLPLLGLGNGEPIHDWHYLLSTLGLLSSDQTIAALLRGLGAVLFLLAIAFGTWLLTRMALARRSRAAR